MLNKPERYGDSKIHKTKLASSIKSLKTAAINTFSLILLCTITPAAQANFFDMEYSAYAHLNGVNLSDSSQPTPDAQLTDTIVPFSGDSHGWVTAGGNLYAESNIIATAADPANDFYAQNYAEGYSTVNYLAATDITYNLSFDYSYLVDPQGPEGYASVWVYFRIRDRTDFSNLVLFDQSFYHNTIDGIAADTNSFAQQISLIAGHEYDFYYTVQTEGQVFQPTAASSGFGYGEITNLQIIATPIPAAVWLFGSGLLGLIGVARRKSAS